MKNNLVTKNSFWMLYSQILKVFLQGFYFLLLARILGVESYGLISTIFAITSFLSPFSGLGFGNLLIKNVVTKKNTINYYFGRSLIMYFFSGVILIILLYLFSIFIFGKDMKSLLILTLGFADIILVRLVELCGQIFTSVNKMMWTANFQVLISVAKLLSIFLYSFFSYKNIILFGIMYFILIFLLTLLAFSIVIKNFHYPEYNIKGVISEIKEGIYFSIGLSSQSIYNDIDKAMLTKLDSYTSTGIYSAAYKIIDVIITPIKAILTVTYPTFFKLGSQGVKKTKPLVIKLILFFSIYSISVFILIKFFSRLIIFILGNEYQYSVEALELLAILPILKSISYVVSDALTGMGYQKTRSIFQLFVAGLNIVLNIIFIPLYSWKGAVASTIICDGLLVIFVGIVYLSLLNRYRE